MKEVSFLIKKNLWIAPSWTRRSNACAAWLVYLPMQVGFTHPRHPLVNSHLVPSGHWYFWKQITF